MFKKSVGLLLLPILALAINSCKNEPVACFTINLPDDSLKVGKEITFDGGCSNYADSYAWDFGDSTFVTTAVVKRSFSTAGFRRIGLTVNGKDGTTTKYREINIKP